ncbi:hypothetical protein FOA52_014987 [Chlamydomonas sp. UWO 241]|nr:hypothetical protein FOA52_014987 [Chlamydomonas sp. UWO 241]
MMPDCGHSLCSTCVRALRQHNCPECRTPFGRSAHELPPNYAMLQEMAKHAPLQQLLQNLGLGAAAGHMVVDPESLEMGQLMDVPGVNQCMYRGKLRGNVVAVKRLEMSDTNALKWAQNELLVLARITEGCHFVCKVLGITVKANRLCIIMHMYAKSLAGYIAEQPGGRLSTSNAVSVARDIGRALGELHAKGIVAMDVKPDNILMTEFNAAVLADFGISKVLESTTSAQQSQIRGTFCYMSPEQFSPDSLTVTTKADIWAFACTFIQMVTGQLPMKGLNFVQMCTRICVQRKAPEVPAGLPSSLTTLLQRCLSFEPAARPSATERVQALGSVFAAGMKDTELPAQAAKAQPTAQQAEVKPKSQQAQMPQRPKPAHAELWAAAEKGDEAEVRSLLGRGADVDEVNENRRTPLFSAAYNGLKAWLPCCWAQKLRWTRRTMGARLSCTLP